MSTTSDNAATKRSLIFWIWLMMAVAYLDRVNITIAGPTMSTALHIDSGKFGIVLSAFTLGYALMQVPGGYLADRFGARGILVAALVIWSIFTAATGQAWSAASLIVIRVLFGMGEGIENGAQFKLIADHFDTRERSTANGLFLTALAIGPAIGAPLTSWLILRAGWRMAFVDYAAIGIVVAVLLAIFLPKSKPTPTKTSADATGIEDTTPVNLLGVARSCAAYLLFNVAFWGFIGWMPTYLSTARHIDLKHLGPMASVPYLVGFVGMIVFGWLGARASNRRRLIVAVGYVGAAVGLYLAFTSRHLPACIGGLSTAAFFLYGTFGPFWADAMEAMPSTLRGRLSGLVNFCGQVGGFVAPIAVGEIVNRTHSFGIGFVLMIVSLAVAAGVIIYSSNTRSIQSPA